MLWFKRWWMRVLSAFCFGFALYQAVFIFDLFSFWGAPYFAFAVLSGGFLFLAQKHTPFLQTVFFVLGLFIFGKALSWQRLQDMPVLDDARWHRLFVAAVRYNLEGEDALLNDWPQDVGFCVGATCPEILQKSLPQSFWIFEKYNADDKTNEVWYINADLQFFTSVDGRLVAKTLPNPNL